MDMFICRMYVPVHSSFMTYYCICIQRKRWVPLVEQALLTLSEHMISSLVLSGVRVSRYLLFCVLFWRLVFVLIIQVIVLPVLRLTDSDYPLDIFKLFLLYFSDTMMMSNFNQTGQFIQLQRCCYIMLKYSLRTDGAKRRPEYFPILFQNFQKSHPLIQVS